MEENLYRKICIIENSVGYLVLSPNFVRVMKLRRRRRQAFVTLREEIVTGITEGKGHVLHAYGKGRIILKWTGLFISCKHRSENWVPRLEFSRAVSCEIRVMNVTPCHWVRFS
jgi:hypothetical protein